MPKKRVLQVSLIFIITISLAFIAGFITRTWLPKDRVKFQILDQAYDILSNRSLELLPEPPSLEYGMIRGMLQASGDPYAIFLEPAMHELETDFLEGNFGGIGVELIRSDNGDVLLYPYPDSPAAQAGIQVGDRLLAVEGLIITPETPLETIQAAIRGNIDETVKLKVSREHDNTPIDLLVARREMALPSVTWRLHPQFESVGIIKINIIASSTPDEILRAVQELADQGVTSYILDLRENGGGLLTESINIARLFLTKGEILQQQYRGQPVETFSVEEPGPLAELKLAVVVNQNTASAAEIIAGALKANNRASIIGAPTFGKDTIQLVFNLDDGSSMHITAARWWIPGLEPPVGEHGVQPDFPIETDSQPGDQAIDTAAELLLNGP
jgi:carboxyl-terminal processing protease